MTESNEPVHQPHLLRPLKPLSLLSVLSTAALFTGCFFSLEAPPTGESTLMTNGDSGGRGGQGTGDGDGDGDGTGSTSPGGSVGSGGSVGGAPGGPFCLRGTTFTDDFENGDDCWDPNVNSSWGIVSAGFEGHGYRQNFTSDEIQIAETIGPDGGWQDVRLEARVKILDWGTDSPSSDHMVALFVRYQNDENFYYAALRGDDKLYARKRVNRIENLSIGSSHVVSNGWQLGQWYDVAIEVEGDTIRLFLDGVLRREETDSDLPGAGQVGIGTYRGARAVFDNVRVTAR